MNRRIFILLAGAPVLSSLAAAATVSKKKKASTVFKVHLHCDDCVKKVMKNIAFEKGVVDLKPDLEKKQVTVVYRTDKTNISKLKAAFKKIGYDDVKDINTSIVQ